MEFPACPKRQTLTVWGRGGTKTAAYRCAEQDADKANEDVTPEDCSECPLRPHLVRNESNPFKERLKPKGATSGALKRDPGGDGYSPCTTRQILEIPPSCSECSRDRIYRICDGDKSPHYRATVDPTICAVCSFRSHPPT